MAVRLEQGSGFLGLKKRYSEVILKEELSLIRPVGVMKDVGIISEDEVSVYDDGDNRRSFEIKYLTKRQINKANLIVLGRNGKPARLKWKENLKENGF
jgi:hypothetical protein